MGQKDTNTQNNIDTTEQDDTIDYKDDALASIITGLNVLIAQASGADMGMAARILYNAKEELVHWAVDMDFHETAKDRFINHHLYESGLSAVGDMLKRIAALQDQQLKDEIMHMLGASFTKAMHVLSKES